MHIYNEEFFFTFMDYYIIIIKAIIDFIIQLYMKYILDTKKYISYLFHSLT
jgi:hypothetical protein